MTLKLKKLSISIALVSTLLLSPSAWAWWSCERAQVGERDYDDVSCLSEDVSVVKKGNRYGFVDKTGKVIIALQYDDAFNFLDGLASVKQNGKWGVINKTGQIITPFQYDEIKLFKGLAWVKKDDQWKFLLIKPEK